MSVKNYFEQLINNYEKCSYATCLNGLVYACKLLNTHFSNPKINEIKQLVRRFINLLFTAKRKKKDFMSRIIKDIYNDCDNKEILEYFIQKIYENMLLFRLKFHCFIYKTEPTKLPFVIIFIDGDGTDLDTNIMSDTNVLSYNFSPGSGIVTLHTDDGITEFIANTLENTLRFHPSTFTEVINEMGCVKTKYIKELDEISNDHIVADYTVMLAHKYRNQSCNVIKPIKNKLYNFKNLLCPGIYVLAVVNTDATEGETHLLNLLIKDDMVTLNQMFNMHDDNGTNVFHNNTVETIDTDKDIELNDICQYFQSLGIVNIGLIDYSCRHKKNVCEMKTKKQMVIEELGANKSFRKFGGKPKRKRKTFKSRRVLQYIVGNQ